MKLSVEKVINQPLEKVWEVFDDPDNMPRWQPTLKEFRRDSGEPGQPGSTNTLIYDEGGRTIEMKESITSRNYPDEFSGKYETDGVVNYISNHFERVGEGSTKWSQETDFQFSGFMRLVAPFMKGSFVKRTSEDMERFKQLAESQ